MSRMNALRIPLFQVDAFAERTFAGNPAAVCPLESWLDDELLRAVAQENNLSETAFLVGGAGRYELRWFTPVAEVDLCGHATLASGFVVLEYLEPERSEVSFETRSGTLAVRRAGARLALDLPRRIPRPFTLPAGYAEALGARPLETLRAECPLLVLDSEAAVRALRPDMGRLAALEPHGAIVTAPADDPRVDFVSRFFAPALGIPEDPVTGSVHSELAGYWSERLGRTALEARQLSARGGALGCTVEETRVRLVGSVAPYLRGTIEL